MNENLPSSITNNYAIQEHTPQLLLAESRVNHSYSQHPHPVSPLPEPWTGTPQPHEKTRGIGYTEKDLGNGNSITIAERLQSGTHAGENQHSPEKESFQNPVKVQYAPDEGGQVRLGLEFTTPGDVMDWTQNNYAKGAARQIIIETINGRRFYVRGDTVYDLILSQRTGEPRAQALKNTEDLPDAIIGQPWMPGSPTLDPVKKVEIGERIAPQAWLGERGPIDTEYDKRGEDPFAAADRLIESLLEAKRNEPQPTAQTEVLPTTNPLPDARKKFDHSQSLISWWRQNRTPEIKQMRKQDRRKARLATFGDYLTANTIDTDFYGKYKSTIEIPDSISDDSEGRIEAISARLQKLGDHGTERAISAAKLVRDIGYTAASKVVDYAGAIPANLKDLSSRTVEHASRRGSQARDIGRVGLSHMVNFNMEQIISTELQGLMSRPNNDINGEDEDN